MYCLSIISKHSFDQEKLVAAVKFGKEVHAGKRIGSWHARLWCKPARGAAGDGRARRPAAAPASGAVGSDGRIVG
jgi:hypothetical protein